MALLELCSAQSAQLYQAALPCSGCLSSPSLSLCFSCLPRSQSWEETQGGKLWSQLTVSVRPWEATSPFQKLSLLICKMGSVTLVPSNLISPWLILVTVGFSSWMSAPWSREFCPLHCCILAPRMEPAHSKCFVSTYQVNKWINGVVWRSQVVAWKVLTAWYTVGAQYMLIIITLVQVAFSVTRRLNKEAS